MGVLPLQFRDGDSVASLGLTGHETFEIAGLAGGGEIPREVMVRADEKSFVATVRIDTPGEADYYRHGGILPYVLRRAGCRRGGSSPPPPACRSALSPQRTSRPPAP